MSKTRERATNTRDRIVRAALQTLQAEGFAETTARAIAARGHFNQALIFYHFGSVENLLLEAFARRSAEQVEKYRKAAEGVTTLSDLVRIATQLHAEDIESGNVTAVVQLMAAASEADSGMLLDRFDEWIGIVEEALGRAVGGTPFAAMIPTREAAYSIASMFLGIELLTRLDAERSEADAVFAMLAAIARVIEDVGPAVLAATSSQAVRPSGD